MATLRPRSFVTTYGPSAVSGASLVHSGDPDTLSNVRNVDRDPDVLWWEHLEVEVRVLHVDRFKGRSTFTAVICEDLAMVEPGLNLLRALGMNLVFALLMDGLQAEGRWPGASAAALTDDPGSSVLSITSLGSGRPLERALRRCGKAAP